MTAKQLTDGLTVSESWLHHLDLRRLMERQLRRSDVVGRSVDVVAIGKASRAMASACREVLGDGVVRQLVVVDGSSGDSTNEDVVVGDHPFPGPESLRAGEKLLAFLDSPTDAVCTVFLVSGGASSLCALPEAPIGLGELTQIFQAALETGANITTLNRLRAATSRIAGGAVLRHVRTPRSLSLIMVDNVISGPRWVASGLTFDYQPDRRELNALLKLVDQVDSPLAQMVYEASVARARTVARPATTSHENRVIARPSMVLAHTMAAAQQLNYRVVDMGGDVHGDVHDVVDKWERAIVRELANGDPLCVVGVGEITVRVQGAGLGGRCQEFAWAMAPVLATLGRDGAFIARATDGRDFVAGVSGAWADTTTTQRAADIGIEWEAVALDNDTFRGLSALNQLLIGPSTGWNLCDLYLALF